MYLNGNRLKEAARLSQLTKEQLQKKSAIAAEDMDYYWDNPVTVPSKHDVDALAKALRVDSDLLLVQGHPKVIALRPDKFSTVDDYEMGISEDN